MIFVWIFAGAVLFFVLSALVGAGDGEHDGNFDTHDGDVGGDHDHGGAHHHDELSPRIFTIKNLAIFAMAFGGAGAIARSLGYTDIVAAGWGVMGGIMIVWLVWLVYRTLYSQQASTTSSVQNLRGSIGRVTIQIPEDGVGQVSVSNEFGTPTLVTAESTDGPIGMGAMVVIHNVTGEHVQVRRD